MPDTSPDAAAGAAAPACANACPLAAAAHRGGLERRVFLSQAVFAAAAVALTACGGGGGGGGDDGGGGPTSPAPVGGSLRVADYPALANTGGVATATLDGTPIALVRTGGSSFIALSRICPHAGFTIDPVANGFLCPGHGAQFNAAGTWTGGQRTTNMRSYPTTYDAATGMLTIG